jgi:hypothetical protein
MVLSGSTWENALSTVGATAIATSTISLLLLAASGGGARAQATPENVPIQKPALQAASSAEPVSCQNLTLQPAARSQPQPAPNAACPPVTPERSANNSSVETSITAAPLPSKDPPKRMFGMIPDFESANNTPANQQPLTGHEKYMLAVQQSFDFSAYFGDAFQSGIQQFTNGQPHYGRGWDAYGERFAAAQADQTTGSMLIYGFFPAVLHEDPRYFRRGTGSPASRVWYAVNRTFVTRRDDGTNGFNRSQMFGQLASCGISTSYYPAQDRSVSRLFLNWIVNLGYNSGYNVLTEYYTDMLEGIFHHRTSAAPPTSAALTPIW